MYPFIAQYNPLTNLMLDLYRAYESQNLEPHEQSCLVYQWLIQLVAEQFPGFQLFEGILERIQYDIPSAITFIGFTPAQIRSEVIQHVLQESFLNKFAEIVRAVASNPSLRPN
jgi:histone acetyltransferase (RNA polymerase elongator complex component)